MRGRTTHPRPVSNSYLQLIKRFPLRRIRNAAERDSAAAVIRELGLRGARNLDSGQLDYLEALAKFVSDYELARSTLPKASPLEVLKFLMDQRSLRATDIGKLIGRSAATMVLKGQRELSKSQIRILAEFFHISPAVFI